MTIQDQGENALVFSVIAAMRGGLTSCRHTVYQVNRAGGCALPDDLGLPPGVRPEGLPFDPEVEVTAPGQARKPEKAPVPLPLGAGGLGADGGPIMAQTGFPGGLAKGNAPIGPGKGFQGGTSIEAPGAYTGGQPVLGPASRFNIFGAPIAVLGGVFSRGLPIGGPVTQIFRGGSGPVPNTLFISTLTPAGPIGNFLIGSGGAPIGLRVFSGGGLPIGPVQPTPTAVDAIQARTSLVTLPAVSFGISSALLPVPPIGINPRGRI